MHAGGCVDEVVLLRVERVCKRRVAAAKKANRTRATLGLVSNVSGFSRAAVGKASWSLIRVLHREKCGAWDAKKIQEGNGEMNKALEHRSLIVQRSQYRMLGADIRPSLSVLRCLSCVLDFFSRQFLEVAE